MPPTRQDRTPERTEGITVELTEFGLWIEVRRNDGGGWEGIILSAGRCGGWSPYQPKSDWPPWTRPCMPPGVNGGDGPQLTTATTSREPPSDQKRGREWGAQPLALGGAPSLHHHKE